MHFSAFAVADDVFINGTLLANKQLFLTTSELRIRNLVIACPTSGIYHFELRFTKNVSVENITTTGLCYVQAGFSPANPSTSNSFLVRDSWVGDTVNGGFTDGAVTITRYFNISAFGSYSRNAKFTIPAPQNRHLRSRLGISNYGITLQSNCVLEMTNVDLYVLSSPSYIDNVAATLNLTNVAINRVYISSGELETSRLILTDGALFHDILSSPPPPQAGFLLQYLIAVSSDNGIYIKNPPSGNSSLEIYGNFVNSGGQSSVQLARGSAKMMVYGNATISTFAVGYMESPDKNSTDFISVGVGVGATLRVANFVPSENLFGYNTYITNNGTLQLGSGSAVEVSSPLFVNTSANFAIYFACLNPNAVVVTDPLLFGVGASVSGCQFRTVANAAPQNFSIVHFAAASGLSVLPLLDPSRFFVNTSFAVGSSLAVYPAASGTPRKALTCESSSCSSFSLFASVSISPISNIAEGETLPIVSVTSGAIPSFNPSEVSPSVLVVVSNSTTFAVMRPFAPAAPPVFVPPPGSPPTAQPSAQGTSPSTSSTPRATTPTAGPTVISEASIRQMVSTALIVSFCGLLIL